MKLSTRGRYGLRVMMELARCRNQKLVMMREIAREQKISRKYIHSLLTALKSAGYVRAVRGSGGGFNLDKTPEEIRLGELIETLEGRLIIADCVADTRRCPRAEFCAAREVWMAVSQKLVELLNSMTLADLVKRQQEKSATPYMYHI